MALVIDSRAVLRQLRVRVCLTSYLAPQDYLREIYRLAKHQLGTYSYLQYAADLGLSRSNVLRLVIIGRRPLSSKAAKLVAQGLELHGPDLRYWTTLVKYANARLPDERDQLFRWLVTYKTKADPKQLDAVQAEYFGEWYHPVIREMTGLADFTGDPAWIKSRLNFPLRLDQIKRSLELLTELGLVVAGEGTGHVRRSAERVTTDAEVDSLALVRYHQKMIEIGRESITIVAEDQRDIRAVTVTIPGALLPELKSRIEQWAGEIAALEQSSEPDRGGAQQVIQVNFQMFAFTKKPKATP